MNRKIFSIISLIASVVLAVGISTVFRACPVMEDGTWMHCHSVQNMILYFAAGMALVSFLMLAMKNKAVQVILGVSLAAASVVVMLLPGRIMSMCMMNTMRCHTVMKPFAMMMAAVILAVNVIHLIRTARS